MKQFISFSGGVESTTMCVLWGNKADGIFADTGYEHKEIYDRIKLVEDWVRSFHRPDFKIHLVKNVNYKSLPDYIRAAKFYPSYQSRFCTRMFKIEPINNYLKHFKDEGVNVMIGLNVDEITQRTGAHDLYSFITHSYPLADAGLNRYACIEILKKTGLYPEFPAYMKRGGCKGCYYKSKKEFTAMALLNPAEFKEVEDLENDLNVNLTTRDQFFTILQGKSMKQIREDATSSLFKPEEIYPAINNATKCGVFCNR